MRSVNRNGWRGIPLEAAIAIYKVKIMKKNLDKFNNITNQT